MKKIVMMLCAAAALFACAKQEMTQPEENQSESEFEIVNGIAKNAPIKFEITVADPTPTRAVKTGWENGDKFYLFFKGRGLMVDISYTEETETWESSDFLDAGEGESFFDKITNGGEQLFHAVHFPGDGLRVNKSESDSNIYYFSEWLGDGGAPVNTNLYYMFEPNVRYTCGPDDNRTYVIKATINLKRPEGLTYFYVPNLPPDGETSHQIYTFANSSLTPSTEEWEYLINRHSNFYNTLLAEVCDVKGLILFPEYWDWPEGCEPDPSDLSSYYGLSSYYTSYDETRWSKMEKAGAVFLPAAGIRVYTTNDAAHGNGHDYPVISGYYEGDVASYKNEGYYWSSNQSYINFGDDQYREFGQCLSFNQDEAVFLSQVSKSYGCSVRLVRDAE